MRPITVTVGPLAAANPSIVAISQVPVANVPMTLNGPPPGVGVTLDHPRQILVTYGNEVPAKTLVVTGTNWSGQVVGETITVPGSSAGTVASALDYLTVTSIVSPLTFINPITVGTNTTAGSPWVNFDQWAFPDVSIQCTLNPPGSCTYTVQQTLDDPNSLFNPVLPWQVTWLPSNDTAVVGATSSQQSNYGFAPVWGRVLVTLGSGTVTATFWQAAVYPQ